MTAAELFESITNGGMSDFSQVLTVLRQREVPWCLIGGLAVNCYVAPVYTADADIVVATDMIDIVVQGLAQAGFKISQFEFSVNAQKPGSDLIIQLTRDERYQPFVTRAGPAYQRRGAFVMRGSMAQISYRPCRRTFTDPEITSTCRPPTYYPRSFAKSEVRTPNPKCRTGSGERRTANRKLRAHRDLRAMISFPRRFRVRSSGFGAPSV